MPSWWDSIETVSRFATWMFWLGVIFTLLAATTGVVAFVAGNRKEELKEQQEKSARELAAARDAELRKRLERRELTPEQQKIFVEILKSAPKTPVDIEASADDPEAAAFAGQIAELLKMSGWPIAAFGRAMYPNGVAPRGIDVGALSQEQIPSRDAVVRAFEAVGFPAKKSFSQNDPTPPMHIVIGTKP